MNYLLYFFAFLPHVALADVIIRGLQTVTLTDMS